MNKLILIVTQIIQNGWWIVGSFAFEDSYQVSVIIISCLCIMLRISEIVLMKKDQFTLVFSLIHLANCVLYTEASFILALRTEYSSYANSAYIVLNYQVMNAALQTWKFIPKYCFPLYGLTRIASFAIIEGNPRMIESVILLATMIAYLIQEQNHRTTQADTPEKPFELSEPEINRPFHHSIEPPKRKYSNKFKKSNTNYSFRANEICSPNPTYLLERTERENRYEKASDRQIQFPTSKLRGRQSNLKKQSIISIQQDKLGQQQQSQLNTILDILPEGILIVNQNQQITYCNAKCKKFFDDTPHIIIQTLKNGLLNAQLPEETGPLIVNPKLKNSMNQRILEELIRIHRANNTPLDVFDALLNPKRYLEMVCASTSPISDLYSMSESHADYQSVCIVTYTIKIENRQQKFKVTVMQDFMTLSQQEQLQQNSQQRVNLGKGVDGLHPILVIMIKNVTSKHKMRQLEREQMVHSSLLYSFSHEFKTPLNSVKLHLSVLQESITDAKLLESIQLIDISNQLLLHQINDILDYAGMQSGTFAHIFTTFSLDEIVTEIEFLYRIQLSYKSIEFTINYDPQLKFYQIRNDRTRIVQVLVNLLTNSSKFTKQGGVVELSIWMHNAKQIKIQVKDNGIGINNTMLDNIKKSMTTTMKRSLHESKIKKGAGLGIQISARIVQGLILSNNGTLEINSDNSKKGTIISFFIEHIPNQREDSVSNPMISEYTIRRSIKQSQFVSEDHSQLSQDLESHRSFSKQDSSSLFKNKNRVSRFALKNEFSPEILESPKKYSIEIPQSPNYFKQKQSVSSYTPTLANLDKPLKKIKHCDQCNSVLIVDDVPFNQIALSALLKYYSIQSDSAYDGYQAIELVKEKMSKHCQYYKLIFMDIEMPGINGFETSKQILTLTKRETNIVMCSAYDTSENFEEAKRIGVLDWVPKPVNQKDLAKVLAKFLNK